MSTTTRHLAVIATALTLNRLLRHESEAAEAYRLAIELLGRDASFSLNLCLYSHELRCAELVAHLRNRGMAIDLKETSPSPFADIIAKEAGLLRVASSAEDCLCAAERVGLEVYTSFAECVDQPALQLINEKLMPEQERAQKLMQRLLSSHSSS